MDTSEFVDYLRATSEMVGQIAHLEVIPPRDAVFGSVDKPLDARLETCLKENHLWPLYSHQADAVNAAIRGENVFIATPAASGKSLTFYIPIFESLLADPKATALYLAPTKALAQDQKKHIRELFSSYVISRGDFDTFDGDTPSSDRAAIRRDARLILSNPDMLHVGILPNHENWRRFFANLKFVVIDEAHYYRGVFGSHLGLVLRRLRRICSRYGSRPQFILASATIGNPKEFAQLLTGLEFTVVDKDGSPYGGKDFIFWNPPFTDPSKSTRRSASAEATSLFAELIAHEIRTLVFARTRRLAEVIFVHARERLQKLAPDKADRIKPYRAGYLPEDRRRIEKELFGGRLDGAVATSALELGVDIGSLDATVLTGYPGSTASVWQQAGRSGRRRRRSLSILIARNDPLDQYFMRHPDFFFKGSGDAALVNPENKYIAGLHLLCAAWEAPLSIADEQYFCLSYGERLADLICRGLLKERKGHYFLSASLTYPAQEVSIRGMSGSEFEVIDASSGALLEVLDSSTALFQLYPGAIYLHQGESYFIRSLDTDTRIAKAEITDNTYYTETKDITELEVKKTLRSVFIRGVPVHLGEVEVTVTVIGFKRKAQFTEEVLGEEPLSLPPQKFETVAVWFEVPEHLTQKITGALDLAGGLHAVEHAAIGILPLYALCDRNDIGGLSTPLHPDTGSATIFIYDAHAGGVGIAEKGYEIIIQLWEATLKTIEECPCESGCPACIQSPKCGNNNEPLDKRAAAVLLRSLLGMHPAEKMVD
ncbi:DEAD/DEAH box helicase domain-containing protein [Dehalogenimonas formicexedens]|uniref:DEAD/DEAH box helicase domain-containing protein n=1 Tax=Dehalogenimonas formicexedens TaxID=1839801 RepID=A0A1P8F6L5_9CHLR|nr:DEAD/DEAH box helicase domain-containing protein [Dehalogenimonas formicexedens]